MTLYNRPRAEVFADNAPPSEIQPFQAWLRGLGIAFDETNGFPEFTGLNGLFNALNQYIKYLEQNGFAEWSADLEYPVGAGVRVGSVWYRAKTQNTNKPPATSQNDWSVFLNAADTTYQSPLSQVSGQVRIAAATTSQPGATRYATSTEVANRSNVSAAVRPIDMPSSASTTTVGVVQFASTTEINNKSNVSKVINPANAATIAQSTDLGVGQTWQNVSRSLGSTYTNTTGRPIQVCVCISHGEQVVSIMRVSNVIVSRFRQDVDSATGYQDSTHTAIIPSGATYSVTGGSLISWAELR